MHKMNTLWTVLNAIFLAVFNTAFFAIGGAHHNATVWTSYGFVHFAYLMLLLAPRMIAEGKSAAVFGFSIYSISSLYFLAELVAGATIMSLFPQDFVVAFVVQLCLAGLYGVLLVSHVIADEHTAAAEEVRQYNISFIKEASANLKGIMDGTQGRVTRSQVERAYDALYSSPARSCEEVGQIEDRILMYIGRLGDAVASGDAGAVGSVSNSLLGAINERNARLKALN